MASSRRSIRSLKDVRTLAGRVGPSSAPSTAYLRIACLEMEKERRGREKESAVQRVQDIDARFREIEAERVSLLQAIGPQGVGAAGGPEACAPRPAPGGLRIRY